MIDHRAAILASLRDGADALREAAERFYHPEQARFRPTYGLALPGGCRGTTRDGRPCAASTAAVLPSGYCHWHDPDHRARRAHRADEGQGGG